MHDVLIAMTLLAGFAFAGYGLIEKRRYDRLTHELEQAERDRRGS